MQDVGHKSVRLWNAADCQGKGVGLDLVTAYYPAYWYDPLAAGQAWYEVAHGDSFMLARPTDDTGSNVPVAKRPPGVDCMIGNKKGVTARAQ